MRHQPWPVRGIYHLIRLDESIEEVRILSWIRAHRPQDFYHEQAYQYIAMVDRDMDSAFDDFDGNELPSNAFIGEQGYFEQSQDNPHVLVAPEGMGGFITLKLHESFEELDKLDTMFHEFGPNIEQEY